MRIFIILLLFTTSAYAEPICRTKSGRICRSQAVRHAFMRLHPCPSTGGTKRCAGWIIDHVKALSCAKTEEERQTLDVVSNLQWQTIADAKAKDRRERKMCGSAD